MECPRHRHRESAACRKAPRNLGATADERNQVSLSQACLLEPELDGGDRAWEAHRHMLLLVVLDEIRQDVELLTLRCAGLGVHERVDAGECGLVVRFGPNRLDLAHVTPPPRRSRRTRRACPRIGCRPRDTGS